MVISYFDVARLWAQGPWAVEDFIAELVRRYPEESEAALDWLTAGDDVSAGAARQSDARKNARVLADAYRVAARLSMH